MRYRIGICQRCGRCCQTKYIYGAMNIFAKIFLRFKVWRAGKSQNFKTTYCEHLRFRRNKAICTHYGKRPKHCVDYPQDHTLIEGCGYKILNEAQYQALPNFMKIQNDINTKKAKGE